MRIRRAASLHVLAGGTLLLLTLPARALPFAVEAWSVQAGNPGGAQVDFHDDFEDGVFDTAFYQVPCGSVAPGDETGGALLLAHPAVGGPCGSVAAVQAVAANAGFGGEATVDATFRFSLPAPGEGFGIQIATPDGSDLVGIVLARTLLGGSDVLSMALFDEVFAASGDPDDVLGTALLSLFPSGFQATTVRMVLSTVASGGLLLPDARFALDGGVLLDVLAPPGAGGLDPASAPFGGALLATAPVPEPAGPALLGLALAWPWLRRRS